MEKQIIEQDEKKAINRSKKTMMILAMASFTMMFAGLTSAYVVSKSRPDWLSDYTIPTAFTISTILLLTSSVTLFFAKKAIKMEKTKQASVLLWATFGLGLAFIYFQIKGFGDFVAQGLYFTGPESNVTTSFFYVIVVLHILHLIAGLIVLLVLIYNDYKQRYNKTQMTGFEVGAMFWHFLDFLWLYLFLFFTFYK